MSTLIHQEQQGYDKLFDADTSQNTCTPPAAATIPAYYDSVGATAAAASAAAVCTCNGGGIRRCSVPSSCPFWPAHSYVPLACTFQGPPALPFVRRPPTPTSPLLRWMALAQIVVWLGLAVCLPGVVVVGADAAWEFRLFPLNISSLQLRGPAPAAGVGVIGARESPSDPWIPLMTQTFTNASALYHCGLAGYSYPAASPYGPAPAAVVSLMGEDPSVNPLPPSVTNWDFVECRPSTPCVRFNNPTANYLVYFACPASGASAATAPNGLWEFALDNGTAHIDATPSGSPERFRGVALVRPVAGLPWRPLPPPSSASSSFSEANFAAAFCAVLLSSSGGVSGGGANVSSGGASMAITDYWQSTEAQRRLGARYYGQPNDCTTSTQPLAACITTQLPASSNFPTYTFISCDVNHPASEQQWEFQLSGALVRSGRLPAAALVPSTTTGGGGIASVNAVNGSILLGRPRADQPWGFVSTPASPVAACKALLGTRFNATATAVWFSAQPGEYEAAVTSSTSTSTSSATTFTSLKPYHIAYISAPTLFEQDLTPAPMATTDATPTALFCSPFTQTPPASAAPLQQPAWSAAFASSVFGGTDDAVLDSFLAALVVAKPTAVPVEWNPNSALWYPLTTATSFAAAGTIPTTICSVLTGRSFSSSTAVSAFRFISYAEQVALYRALAGLLPATPSATTSPNALLTNLSRVAGLAKLSCNRASTTGPYDFAKLCGGSAAAGVAGGTVSALDLWRPTRWLDESPVAVTCDTAGPADLQTPRAHRLFDADTQSADASASASTTLQPGGPAGALGALDRSRQTIYRYCGIRFGRTEAQAACRSLGYTGDAVTGAAAYAATPTEIAALSAAASSRSGGASFTQSTSRATFCSGSSTLLSSCVTDVTYGGPGEQCTSEMVVGVSCRASSGSALAANGAWDFKLSMPGGRAGVLLARPSPLHAWGLVCGVVTQQDMLRAACASAGVSGGIASDAFAGPAGDYTALNPAHAQSTIYMQSVACMPGATALPACTYAAIAAPPMIPSLPPTCSPALATFARCDNAPPPQSWTVRREGFLVLARSGQDGPWGMLCGFAVDRVAATALCRALGFTTGGVPEWWADYGAPRTATHANTPMHADYLRCTSPIDPPSACEWFGPGDTCTANRTAALALRCGSADTSSTSSPSSSSGSGGEAAADSAGPLGGVPTSAVIGGAAGLAFAVGFAVAVGCWMARRRQQRALQRTGLHPARDDDSDFPLTALEAPSSSLDEYAPHNQV